jgi:hypothetical protein
MVTFKSPSVVRHPAPGRLATQPDRMLSDRGETFPVILFHVFPRTTGACQTSLSVDPVGNVRNLFLGRLGLRPQL